MDKEEFMSKLLRFWALLLAAVLMVGFAGCDEEPDEGDGGDKTPAVYRGFYNYPTGRVNNNGLLTIRNTVNSKALLFTHSVEGANYIGTIDALGEVKVRLSDQKFWTIVAVDKENYEEKTSQASQYSSLTYYSNTQPFTVSVTPSNTSGNTSWVMNNNTDNFWIQVKSADGNTTYAVLRPGALRVSIPINLGQSYPFIPIFSRELKYDGKVIALSETADRSQGDIASTTSNRPIFTKDFGNADIPGTSIRPTVLLINNSGLTVEVFYSSSRMTNGAIGGEFVVLSGDRQLISGFNADDNTNQLNFSAIPWTTRKYVTQSTTMENNKVYQVTLGTGGNTTTVEVKSDTEIYE
jgi:hypothetical protein